jgi:hypothetical protein
MSQNLGFAKRRRRRRTQRQGGAHVYRRAVIAVHAQRHKKRASARAALDSLLSYYTISRHRAARLPANTVAPRSGAGGLLRVLGKRIPTASHKNISTTSLAHRRPGAIDRTRRPPANAASEKPC